MTWEAEHRPKVFALRAEGHSVRKIAAKTGIPKSTVHEWLRDPSNDGKGADVSTQQQSDALAGSGLKDEGPTNENAALPEGIPNGPPVPPAVNRTWMDGIHRYVNAIANGVSHTDAVVASRQIDPQFEMTTDDHIRLMSAMDVLGGPDKLEGPVKLAEYLSFNTIAPPAYVQDTYAAYELGQQEIADMADHLLQLAKGAYLDGINDQLYQLGRQSIDQVTEQAILNHMTEATRSTAEGIIETFNRNLATETYTSYIGRAAVEGRQMSRAKLADEIDQWGAARADWKGNLIANTEANRYYNEAAQDFAVQNSDIVQNGFITPDQCKCHICLDLVELGTQPATYWAGIELPVHPGCMHEVVWEYLPNCPAGMAEGDGEGQLLGVADGQACILGDAKLWNATETAGVSGDEANQLLSDGLAGMSTITDQQRVWDDVSEVAGLDKYDGARIASRWIASNTNEFSTALQDVARERWGGTMSPALLDRLEKWSTTFSGPDEDWKAMRLDVEKYLNATYVKTQQELAGLGIDNIKVYRGIRVDSIPEGLSGSLGTVSGNPLSSWTLDRSQAELFAKGESALGSHGQLGLIFEAEVPRSEVVGLAQTGLGAPGHAEVVLRSQTLAVKINHV